MSATCHHRDHPRDAGPGLYTEYRRVLWVALLINAGMFALELVSGMLAGSVALLADSLDFLSDAANYGISLLVLGRTLRWRAGAALVKGASMGAFGLWVLGSAVHHATLGTVPQAAFMGAIGLLALVANLFVAVSLFRYRDGDSNMRSVWLCIRNDAIGNVAVIAAATGVFATTSGWPDFAVAVVMAALALAAAYQVIRHAVAEWREPHSAAVPRAAVPDRR